MKEIDLLKLDQLLDTHNGLELTQLHGFLCAMNSGPNSFEPEEWLPVVFAEAEELDLSIEEELVRLILELDLMVQNELTSDIEELHPIIDSSGSRYEINSSAEIISPWANGYLLGVAFDEESWITDDAEDIEDLLIPIVMVASVLDDSIEDINSAQLLELASTVPATVIAIYDYWSAESEWIGEDAHENGHTAEYVEAQEPYVSEIKIGRNDDCPCGSGKKYKKCCLVSTGANK